MGVKACSVSTGALSFSDLFLSLAISFQRVIPFTPALLRPSFSDITRQTVKALSKSLPQELDGGDSLVIIITTQTGTFWYTCADTRTLPRIRVPCTKYPLK